MTTPEPLTYQEIEKMEPNLLMMCGPRWSDAIDRLLYTARLGAKFLEATKKDFVILKRAGKGEEQS